MKLTLPRAALLPALAVAQRIVERRNTIPILSNIRLVAEGERLALTATDLDIEIRTAVPAAIDRPGALTAPAAMLHDIVRKLPAEAEIGLDAPPESEGGRMVLRSGRSRFQINTLPAGDYPDITAGELPHRFALDAKALAGLIASTDFAISTEEARYYLNGIYLHPTQDGAHLAGVATDGHRLARLHLPLPAGAAGLPGVIVPRKAVAEIHKLAEAHKGEIGLSFSTTKIRVEAGEIVLTSKLIDGTFPDYVRVIPQGNDKRVTLDSATLAAAVDRCATISSERGRAVKLALGDGRLVLSVTNPDSGDAREEIDADYAGPPIEIGFNAAYLRDQIAILGGDTVTLALADPGSPAILRSSEESALLTVLMPIRV